RNKYIYPMLVIVALLCSHSLFSQNLVSTNNFVAIPCGSTCATLAATVTATATASQYTVNSIPYDSTRCFNCGTSVLANTDDLFSTPITIPFPFCFFGNTYTQFIIGANGIVSFNTNQSGGINNYLITNPLPTNNPVDLLNSIMAPWQDLDPTFMGGTYYTVTGTAPNRTMQISWYRIPMYGDSNSVNTSFCHDTIFQTQMIVLHETTNAVDIEIANKGICPSWNGGLAMEGIQDASATLFYTVPGRNATQWTAHHDAWRFTPAGVPNYKVGWFRNSTQLSNIDSVIVCPTVATDYRIQATYYLCNNDSVVVNDTVHVSLNGPPTSTFTAPSTVCTGANATINFTGNAQGATFYNWDFDGGTIVSGFGGGPYHISWSTPGTKNVTLTVVNGVCTSALTTIPVTVNAVPNVTVSPDVTICLGDSTTLTAGGASTYTWSPPYALNTVFGATVIAYPSVTTTYTVTGNNLGCSNAASVKVTVNPACTLQPDVLPGLSLWLMADTGVILTSGVVTQWTDFSPNHLDATVTNGFNGPQWGASQGFYSKPCVKFNGSTTALSGPQIPGLGDSSVTIFILAHGYTQTGSTSTGLFSIGGTDGLWLSRDLSSESYRLVNNFTNSGTVLDASGCATNAPFPYRVFGFEKKLGVSVELDTNSTMVAFNNSNSGLNGPFVNGTYSIGNSQSVLFGEIAEVIVYNTALTPNQKQRVENYLYNKYAPPVDLGADITSNYFCPVELNESHYNFPYYRSAQWSTGQSGPSILAPHTGTYSVTVTNLFDQVSSDTINVTFPITTLNRHDTIVCAGQSFGSVPLYSLYSDTDHFTSYLWSTGQVTASIIPTLGGHYYVLITDSTGCSLSSDTITFSFDSVFVQVPSLTVNCFGDSSGMFCATVTGNGPFSYLWNSLITTQCLTHMPAGNDTILVTDALGCSARGIVTITQPPLITATITASSDTIYLGQTDTLFVHPLGGNPPYIYTWNDATHADHTPITTCFNYTVTVADQNGCTAIGIDSSVICMDDFVWPGDADYDGTANNNDLLAIGLAYGATGPIRPNASLLWVGQPATNWISSDTLPNGVNYKHTDCNGDGIIDADDTIAIIQNYGLIHTRGGGQNEWRSGIPALTVNLVPDTAYAGDSVTAEFILGDSGIIANNVYGLAFTLNYDLIPVDTAKTYVTFTTSWLGTSAEKISIAKDFKTIGQLQCAVTRIDHRTKTGSGQIGAATFVITTDNINGKNYSFYTMKAWISNVTVIDSAGNLITVNEGSDSTQIGYLPTGINNITAENNRIQIFPNPANNLLTVASQLGSIDIKITDVPGKEIIRYAPGGVHTTQLDVSQLSSGIYLIEVTTPAGTSTQRLVISK
ncbi:MAG: hypothetical protein JWO06_2771, partial [Bacteroidota bacterium]|nr:hypothetical protein [Bacteroidota bacterium]